MDFNNVNPGLMKLAELLKMSIPKSSHGYTISEAGPEIVTAPGVYFPSEKGEVIPLQSRAEGGTVSPNSSDTEKEKLGILREIISQVKPRQGTESRQFGGPVSPDSEPSLMDQIEKTKYDIFKSAISALKPQKQQTTTGGGNIPLQSRQQGGSVNPNILEELLSAMRPGGRGPFTKSGGGYGERISAYGSPGWFGSEKDVAGGKPFSLFGSRSLPTPPSQPGLPKPITSSSYGMMPEAMKPGEGESLWQKKQGGSKAGVLDLTSPKITTTLVPGSVETGVSTPSNLDKQYSGLKEGMNLEGWGIKKEGNTYTLPGTEGTMTLGEPNPEGDILAKERLFSRQYGGFVSPDLEELKARKLWEQQGYPEARLAELRKNISPGIMGVQPGFQKSYYEAHPEEKLMDEETARMKPLTDAIMKSIKDEETRLQGYGLGFGPTPREMRAGITRKGTPSQIPELVQGLKGLTPTLVAGGRRGILPAGVTTPKQPTLSPVGQLMAERDILPPDDPRRESYNAAIKKATEQPEKLLPDTTPSGLREFEVAEGIDPSKRGTPEYSKSYKDFLGGKKEATRDPIEQKKLGTTLRKEFNSLQPVKDYRDIETRFNVMEKAVEESKTTNNFVAVDQALITIFNKMTDPQSVVRESEYLRTPQDLALWNRIKGKVSKMVAGGAGLTPDDRNALFSMAKQFQSAYESKFNQLRNEYRGYAVDYGLDPETVIKSGGGKKTIVKQFYSQSLGKTKYVYSDGTEEIK